MLIYVVDDEANMLYLLHEAVIEAVPDTEIRDFRTGSIAVAHMEESGERPDVVFSDIRMPGLNGLELAMRLKKINPETKLVFVTGYDYALDAYRFHVDGYITKPVEAERIREELDHLFPDGLNTVKKLKVQCFGMFEIFWKNEPLSFTRKQSKELFAYLIDRRGVLCSTDEIIAVLWENNEIDRRLRHRVWNLKSDLRMTLNRIGMEDVLVCQGNCIGVRTSLLDCDYYRMLEDDVTVKNTFRGEYMEQYSWAEKTKESLSFVNSHHNLGAE